VDRTVGLSGTRADIAMMRTRDSHGRVALTRFRTTPAVRAEPARAARPCHLDPGEPGRRLSRHRTARRGHRACPLAPTPHAVRERVARWGTSGRPPAGMIDAMIDEDRQRSDHRESPTHRRPRASASGSPPRHRDSRLVGDAVFADVPEMVEQPSRRRIGQHDSRRGLRVDDVVLTEVAVVTARRGRDGCSLDCQRPCSPPSRGGRRQAVATSGSQAPGAEGEWRPERRKPRICGAFSEAAEGTRTLDLLHGKQTL
jgi:hypothetical protein